MADILIKGLELPKEGHYYLEVFFDGEIRKCTNPLEGFVNTEATAIELPSHGRLVDKDAILDAYNKELYYWQESPRTAHDELVHIVQNAPVVVEASR